MVKDKSFRKFTKTQPELDHFLFAENYENNSWKYLSS